MKFIFVITVFVSICTRQISAFTKQEALQNIINPWPHPNFPNVKMTYNYQVSGLLQGTQIVSDGTHSYSKAKGYQEGQMEKAFSYFQEIKVDTRGNRASQKLWTDETQSELIAHQVVDFAHSRVYSAELNDAGNLQCQTI